MISHKEKNYSFLKDVHNVVHADDKTMYRIEPGSIE